MNKKGLTILELLVSIVLIAIVSLLLFQIIFVLNNINNNADYASSDEIARAEIIKNVESDFLKLKLNGINIVKNERETIINFSFLNINKELVIKEKEIKYDNIVYKLESKNATYSLCPSYKFLEIDKDYYLVKLTIPVLINNKNTKKFDDLVFTYLNLKNDDMRYLFDFKC